MKCSRTDTALSSISHYCHLTLVHPSVYILSFFAIKVSNLAKTACQLCFILLLSPLYAATTALSHAYRSVVSLVYYHYVSPKQMLMMKYVLSVFCVIFKIFNTTYASFILFVAFYPFVLVSPAIFFLNINLFPPANTCDVTLDLAAGTN